MRSVAFAILVTGFAYWTPAYRDAITSVVGAHGYASMVVACVAAFLPPWLMGRAFMTSEEAQRIAASINGREDYYDFDTYRMVRNPQDTDPEGTKLQYLLGSIVAWIFQCYIVYKAFFYR